MTVLGLANGLCAGTDQDTPIPLKNARFIKCQADIQASLSAQCRQYRIGLLDSEDLLDNLDGNWLDIGAVSHLRVGHDRRWIGVNQHDLVSLLAQGLTRLGARVVKLTCLANDNRTCTNDQNLVNVSTLGHFDSASRLLWQCLLLMQAEKPDADRAALASAVYFRKAARPGEISRS